MEHCPTCAEPVHGALVVCAGCGEALPLRVVVISEGSRGGGYALVKEVSEGKNADLQNLPVKEIERNDEEASL